jgi:KDO2-lipid IV(A) lauroyltransferase
MTIKQLMGKLSWWIVKCFLFFVKITPVAGIYLFVDFIVWLGTALPWKRKTLAMKNMAIVFPESTTHIQKNIFRQFLRNMLRNYFDLMILEVKNLPAEKVLAMAEGENLQELDNVLKKGNGVILFSGHFGSFPLMIIWLSLKGYPIAAVYKEASNFPDDFFGGLMRKYGVTPVKYTSDKSLTSSIIRCLKQNQVVLIQNDQSKPDGVYINFFNRYVPAAPGPVVLSKRTGASIIPAYIYRQNKHFHHIIFFKELRLSEAETLEQYIIDNTQLLSDWIAQVIVEHPEEWLWLHNRWKREKPFPQTANGTVS